jgi:hypothetical protein
VLLGREESEHLGDRDDSWLDTSTLFSRLNGQEGRAKCHFPMFFFSLRDRSNTSRPWAASEEQASEEQLKWERASGSGIPVKRFTMSGAGAREGIEGLE